MLGGPRTSCTGCCDPGPAASCTTEDGPPGTRSAPVAGSRDDAGRPPRAKDGQVRRGGAEGTRTPDPHTARAGRRAGQRRCRRWRPVNVVHPVSVRRSGFTLLPHDLTHAARACSSRRDVAPGQRPRLERSGAGPGLMLCQRGRADESPASRARRPSRARALAARGAREGRQRAPPATPRRRPGPCWRLRAERARSARPGPPCRLCDHRPAEHVAPGPPRGTAASPQEPEHETGTVKSRRARPRSGAARRAVPPPCEAESGLEPPAEPTAVRGRTRAGLLRRPGARRTRRRGTQARRSAPTAR